MAAPLSDDPLLHTPSGDASHTISASDRQVILASSLGTVFEWYDFYLYGALASVIAQKFFSGLDPTAGFIFALLAFAAGFLVRPLGAVVFGRLGDMVGRKRTFMFTIVLMGGSTFAVGLLPGYASIGWAAPALLVLLRMLQGLALGGEYGGAATYVAEHAPQGRRGAYTSWIQTTATLGLFLSLVVILGTRLGLGEEVFSDWGWRLPFVVSALLLAVSVWIRSTMQESPAFARMQREGSTSKAPLSECFGQWKNLKIILLALFGVVAGQAVVWYTGQFYALFFLTSVLKVEASTANVLLAVALALATPFFVLFGSLSDRIGRKPVVMAGLLLACVSYLPLFKALTEAANPALAQALRTSRIVVQADPMTCSFQGSPLARELDFTSACDISKRALAQNAASYANEALPSGAGARVQVGEQVLAVPNAELTPDGTAFTEASTAAVQAFRQELVVALRAAGYPAKADPARIDRVQVVLILTVLVLLVTMVYGPIAAMLVELFPTRIRYTSMSLPYHLGNGWFGGLMPTFAFAMVASHGDIYHGLWYPIVIAGACFVIGMIFLRETKDVDIYAKFLYWHPSRLRK
jgi:MFS family permease